MLIKYASVFFLDKVSTKQSSAAEIDFVFL